jgi:opacity protein-like surface antigen
MVGMALIALAAADAGAQVEARQFQIAAYGGWHIYADGSGLEGGPSLGGDATYYILPSVGIGLNMDLTFAEVDGRKFPAAALNWVDSTTLHIINQPVDVWTYGAHVKLQLPARRFAPYALLGAGGYTLFLDPQQNDDVATENGFVVKLGLGADFAVSERLGVNLSITDNFFPDWSSDVLLPVREQNQNTIFPDLNPEEELDDSVHNLRFVAGVTIVPGG